MNLKDEIKYIKGVGPKMAEEMNKAGIFTVMDLLLYFPRDYENLSLAVDVANCKSDEKVILECCVVGYLQDSRTRTGKVLTNVIFSDGNNKFKGVWFNQPYIKKSFKIGCKYIITGKIKKIGSQYSIENPKILRNSSLDKEKIIARYPLRGKLNNNFLNKIITNVISEVQINENLPQWLIEKYNLYSLKHAILNIHCPCKMEDLKRAKERLKFQELFTYSLKILLLKDFIERNHGGISFKISPNLKIFKEKLPFNLTEAQNKVIREILIDEKKPKPMNRLVQGDVGSGKTIVAIIAMLNVVDNGYQAVLMAPTEILARQHYEEIKKLLENFEINTALLVGSTTKKQKESIKEGLKSGDISMIIGTHALLEEDVEYKKLGMVVTDEQHRFGVNQRCRLYSKGNSIDVLVMTATPIPRTLALYLYGDLHVSVIDEMPPNRKPVDTYYVNKDYRERVYKFALEEIEKGRQIYVVCPLVEENEELKLNSVEKLFEELKEKYFKDIPISMLHGKMKGKEKEEIMEAFKKNFLKVIISTTVIEVGVNVPNATMMIIENAERFGLAQLHQLRGRVGRGEHKSYCVLIADSKTETTKRRMEIMKSTNNGFVVAEEDLKIRGTGELFGIRQSGENELMIADVVEDFNILKYANAEAKRLLQSEEKEDIKVRKEIWEKLQICSDYICFN